MFVVNTRNTPLIHILTKQQHFDYPIFIDKKRKMQRINNFPKEPIYQTFLLDKNNRVLLIGNPIGNIKLWKLYKDIIIE